MLITSCCACHVGLFSFAVHLLELRTSVKQIIYALEYFFYFIKFPI